MSDHEKDYVLGTGDPEIARLGLQHAVWRERALAAWRRAGVKRGRTVMDLGCGPGYAALDLAEIVGPSGRVIAVDRSRRFLEALERTAAARGFTNIEIVESDVEELRLPERSVDVVWCRWLLIFTPQPEGVVARVAPLLKPRGAFVLHEYGEYRTWRLAPRSEAHDQLVEAVVASWRAHDGDADVALRLPAAFRANGLRVEHMQPLIDAATPADFVWSWAAAYVETGTKRLVELGFLDAAVADRVRADWAAAEADPGSLMITPLVLEIIGRKGA
jgi:ubiquinone/menaquinone biosynthesis C-methylase UbiE